MDELSWFFMLRQIQESSELYTLIIFGWLWSEMGMKLEFQ